MFDLYVYTEPGVKTDDWDPKFGVSEFWIPVFTFHMNPGSIWIPIGPRININNN